MKKLAIFREHKAGHTSNGQQLSGLISVAQVDNELTVNISISNLALKSGAYVCYLVDTKERTEKFALSEKNCFTLTSNLDLSNGFFAGIFHEDANQTLIAWAVNGVGDFSFLKSSNK